MPTSKRKQVRPPKPEQAKNQRWMDLIPEKPVDLVAIQMALTEHKKSRRHFMVMRNRPTGMNIQSIIDAEDHILSTVGITGVHTMMTKIEQQQKDIDTLLTKIDRLEHSLTK